MELVKFRIKNYKSIDDSGDCYFSNALTILAGKNESGKTSILEALEDFHQDKTIREEARPIGKNLIPTISVSFLLSKKEVNEIFEKVELGRTLFKEINITLIKSYGNSSYSLDAASRDSLGLPNTHSFSKEKIIKANKKVESLIKLGHVESKFPILNNQKLSEFKTQVNQFISQNPNLAEIKPQTDIIFEAIDFYYKREEDVKNFTEEFVASKLPYFILFSSFEDEFPESISTETLSQNPWAQDLEQISNFSIKNISSDNSQEQVEHENSVNVEFLKKFTKYWSQDKIRLQIKKDGNKLNFWIIENGRPYFPSQRSKGQQWYLSFYIKIVARLSEDKPNVILIDEPGLYLHAKAQKDLLQVLADHAKGNPVVFSTHSPYLITEDNLENVRLVEKDRDGTKILGKIHAHPTAHKETLTPILTAIGLGINDSITNIDQKNNVVVEGPEDVFYLRAFKELENKDLKTNFINGGGASNLAIVGAILEGWGANVYYLFDNDQGKRDGQKHLNDWKILPDVIKVVLQKDGAAIVDLFSVDDFKKYVLEDESISYSSSNSDYLKNLKPRPDKVLLSRKFLQKVRQGPVKLSEETVKKISSLFKEIEFN